MKQLEWFVTGIVILALAVVGVLYLTSGQSPEAKRAAERKATVSTGIRAMLDELSGLEIVTMVSGIQIAPGEWDFRGNAAADGRTEPFYGVAELVCDRIQSTANCWRIVTLERDVRTIVQREGVTALPSTEPATLSGSSTAGQAAPLRTGGTAPAAQQPTVESETTAPAAPAPAAAAQEPAPVLWRVTGATVNGRAGPGTSFPIVARLGPEHRLSRISIDEGWGHYRVLSPAGDAGQEIWVWADLVAEAQ